MNSFMRLLMTGLLAICIAAIPAFAASVPRSAADLSFPVPGGKQVSLDQFKGKVVALEFLLTTCPSCKRTSRIMQQLFGEYADKGFQPLAVAINAGAETLVGGYAREVGVTYPIGVGDRNMAVAFLGYSAVMRMMMPQLVVIDKKGVIRAQYAGTDRFFRNEEANMRRLLTELLAE